MSHEERAASDSLEGSVYRVGQRAELTRRIEQRDIDAFADLIGDHNPVHVDPEFAAGTRFGRTIAHGMWGGSLISAVLGTKLPGAGSIYMNQSLKFVRPIYVGDTITAVVEITDVRADKPILTLRTECVNQNGEPVLTGEARMLVG